MSIIVFSETTGKLKEALQETNLRALGMKEIWIARDLLGCYSLLIPMGSDPGQFTFLAEALSRYLGAHAYPQDEAITFMYPEELEALKPEAVSWEEQGITVYLVDREVTGYRWGTASEEPEQTTRRIALFALKGGVGRSTAAFVLAAHLAKERERVLLLDFDLESPSLSAILERNELPDFGIVEWLVEDLVDQGNEVFSRMVGRPEWSEALQGDLMVVPAYGSGCREHLAQLGRAYMDKPPDKPGDPAEPWIFRVRRLVRGLERQFRPTIVIMDSRNGLHSIGAALVAHLATDVFLFAVDSQPTWDGYRILFQHWRDRGVIRSVRERLRMVAALIPPDEEGYLPRFRQHAWNLFNEFVYDEVPPEASGPEWFSFQEMDETAPHAPLPIYWDRALFGQYALRLLDDSTLQAAYGAFIPRVMDLLGLQ